ncbi:hypothetical protein F4694_002586 [Bacillus niacini]|uniref:Helicase HerA central domain-containing protein n=1 Tax=Neobacillus niacini TaxID=86668 RepID=A0A852TC81_9BACI|nr:DUF87 domain-containing protein [Neobacillus niacini]NYE05811.1 hypothetical protein [Neobacillus niacini]
MLKKLGKFFTQVLKEESQVTEAPLAQPERASVAEWEQPSALQLTESGILMGNQQIWVDSEPEFRQVGLWAAEIKRIPDSMQIHENEEQALRLTLDYFSRTLDQLSTFPSNSLELVWDCIPDPNSPTKAKISLYLIGRVLTDSRTDVVPVTNRFWQLISSAFPNKYYALERISTSQISEIQHHRNVSYTAVVNKSQMLADSQYVPNGDFFYWTNPFPRKLPSSLEFIAESLINYGERCSLSFTLATTEWTHEEGRAIEQVANFLHGAANGQQHHYFGHVPPDTNAKLAFPSYQYYLNELRKPCFLYKIQVFGEQPYTDSLISGLRSLLVSTSQDEIPSEIDIFEGEYFRDGVDKFLTGAWDPGYVQHWRESNGATFWEREDAPHMLRRLPYLVTRDEAVSFFRLPIAINGEFPGITIRESKGSRVAQVPPEATQGDIPLGNVVSRDQLTDVPIKITLSDLKKHMLVLGVPGSGKTTFTLDVVQQLWNNHGLPTLVIEPSKKEYRSLLSVIPDLQIFTVGNEGVSPFRLNPLDVPNGVTLEVHLSSLKTAFMASFPMGGPLPALFDQALNDTYRQYGWRTSNQGGQGLPIPSFRDFVEVFRNMDLGYSANTSSDILTAGLVRLESMLTGTRGRLFDTVNSVPLEDILSKPTIIELDAIMDPDERALIMSLLLIRLNAYLKVTRLAGSPLKHVMLLEEAHTLLAETKEVSDDKAKARSTAVELFTNMLAEVRNLGEGLIVVDQSPTAISSKVVRYTGIKVAFRLVDQEDRRVAGESMNMDDTLKREFASLKPGEALTYFEKLPRPQLIQSRDFKELYNVQESFTDTEVKERSTYWETRQDRLIPFYECPAVGCSKTCRRYVREDSEYYSADPSRLQAFEELMNTTLETKSRARFNEGWTRIMPDLMMSEEEKDIFTGCFLMHCLRSSTKQIKTHTGRSNFIQQMKVPK